MISDYMSEKDINKVLSTDGIEQASQQFFLTSAKASCCSSRVQIIGFDPDTDFTVLPWIDVSYVSQIMDGDLIVGSNINVPQNKEITFYNTKYHVAGQLAPTGTGLDSAVYTNIDTIKKMAGDASNLLDTNPFQGVNIDTCASAVFIKVADGYNITDVADDINIHITKVEASSARTMISDIAEGLGNVSMIIRIVVILVWILAAVILVVVQALLSNERKKEFAVLRIMGASRKMLFQMMSVEAVMTGLIGAVAGIGIALILIYPISGALKNALGLPFLAPTAGSMVLFGISALVISIASGILTAVFFARRITKSETGLLLREDS